MIQYKQGEFSIKGVQFKIPDNFFINCDPECTGEFFMELRPPENDYILRIRIYDGCESVEAEMKEHYSEDAGGIPIEPPSPAAYGGMTGLQVAVRGSTTGTQCYYLHLAMTESGDEQFYLYIETVSPGNIPDIINSPDIVWFLDNIWYK